MILRPCALLHARLVLPSLAFLARGKNSNNDQNTGVKQMGMCYPKYCHPLYRTISLKPLISARSPITTPNSQYSLFVYSANSNLLSHRYT